MRMKQVLFPRDEHKHDDSIIEWWYFNGHLWDKRNSRYAYMTTLFRVNTRRIGDPIVKRFPMKTLYFSHSLLFNVAQRSFSPMMDYVVIPSRDSFAKERLFINYTSPFILNGYFNNVIEERNLFEYRVKNEQVDLELDATKKPLLVGGNGYQRLGTKGSYYYSLTHLKTSGRIRRGNREIDVSGISWMDHQWSSVNFAQSMQWTWFSIQLNNDTEILCYIYGDKESEEYWASIVHANGHQDHTTDVHFRALNNKWHSLKTKATYSLSWRISIPSKGVDLTVRPLREDLEMLFGKINYWEGPMSVQGTVRGERVTGNGFMEIFGRPSQFNELTAVRDLLRDYSSGLKKQLASLPKRLMK